MSEKSYQKIFQSSSMVGGAQGINMILGMVRMKFVAVFLGPAGLGLLGLLQTIQTTATTVSGLGVNSSGVREVADANGSDDEVRLALTVTTLRRVCWVTGVLGAFLLVVLAETLSWMTFQSDDYTTEIAWLALAVLLAAVSLGQMAVIQGMRRIGDLAKLNIISSAAGTVVAILFYWSLGIHGIIPALIVLAALNLVGSYWYSRKITIVSVTVTWWQSFRDAKGLIGLGLAFMWTGMLVACVDYATRSIITHEIGLMAVGIYLAAFKLSGMFINFVLGAMSADYYPSLTAVSEDHEKMRSLVNQQTEVGVLLAVPGLLATLAFAPWIITIFYTSDFAESSGLLQWFVLGCLSRVISWPMGFIVLAKGRGALFAIIQTISGLTHLLLIWLGLKVYGIEGVAMAFATMHILYILGIYAVSRNLIDFKWTNSVKKLLLHLLPIVIGAFALSRVLPLLPATAFGVLITSIVGFYCLKGVCLRLGNDHKLVQKLFQIAWIKKWLKA